MPIPKPRDDEEKNAFISRCMGNSTMLDEYPDSKQRAGVCNTAWTKKFSKEENSMIKDILSVGVWNNIPFKVKDLLNIVEAFNKLKDVHDVPLKLGHIDGEEYKKGQPALGWVDDLYVEGEKLFAKFIDVPPIMKKAFGKKLYRKVSVELDRKVEYQSDTYDWVLSGVALLGADIPAVNDLADLGAYFSITGGERLCFAYEENTKGDTDMSLESLESQVKELTANFSKLNSSHESAVKQNADLKAENELLKKQTEEFDRKEKERQEAESKAAVTAARTTVTEFFNKLVTDKSLTPAERDATMELLGVDDDTKVVSIDLEKVKKMPGLGGKDFSRSTSPQGKGDVNIDINNPGQSIVDLANDYIDQNGGPEKVSFERASQHVMRNNPELATAWKN